MKTEKNIRLEIAKALAATNFVVSGNEIPFEAMDLMVEDLVPHGLPAVLDALVRCRRECRGRMSLADVLDRIIRRDGRPEADEAWMTALLALDEAETVVWTTETRDAFAVARPALEINDKVGARMAFKAAYDRLVEWARDAVMPAQWCASMGWDTDRRRHALEAAVQCGHLLPDHVHGLLPPPQPQDEPFCETVLKLACVNGVAVDGGASEARAQAREHIASIRAMLAKKV